LTLEIHESSSVSEFFDIEDSSRDLIIKISENFVTDGFKTI